MNRAAVPSTKSGRASFRYHSTRARVLRRRFPGEGQATYGAVLAVLLDEYLDRHSPERRDARRRSAG